MLKFVFYAILIFRILFFLSYSSACTPSLCLLLLLFDAQVPFAVSHSAVRKNEPHRPKIYDP